MIVASMIFLLFTGLLFVAGVLAHFQIGWVRFTGAEGRARDGLPIGASAPHWRLPDLSGEWWESYRDQGWTLLLFADHSIGAFPDLPAALTRIQGEEELIVLALARESVAELADAAFSHLGIEVPIIAVDESFYPRHNVWAMPFGIFVSNDGAVGISTIISAPDDLFRGWLLAQQALAPRTSAPASSNDLAIEPAR